jgi:mannitol/fructose-specific phosphotransferase system IIA component (Ntr-type)
MALSEATTQLEILAARITPSALFMPNMKNVTTKVNLFQFVSNLLYTNGLLIKSSAFMNALLEREEMGPTLLQDGMAIPHGQDACVLQPSLCVCLFQTAFHYETPFSNALVNKVFLFSLPISMDNHPVEANYFKAFSTNLINKSFTQSIHPSMDHREFCRHTSQTLASGVNQIFLS